MPSRHGTVFRPLIEVELTGPAGRVQTEMLLDSGADIAIIDLRMAETLGLDLGPIETMTGIGTEVPGYRGRAFVRVEGVPSEVLPVEIPLFIPVNGELPSFPVLGRAAFFQAFDVRFSMGPIPSMGTFSVSAHR